MKFKLENIKVNVAEEAQFELGKLEVEYSIEEMVEMHQTFKEVLQQINEYVNASYNVEEKDDCQTSNSNETQMQDLFDSFAKIYSDDKDKETTEHN
jgi:hypothetical protein